MSWDYWTFQRQPISFIRQVWEHMSADNQVESEKAKEMEMRSRSSGSHR